MAINAREDELTASDAAVALGVGYHTVLRWVQTRWLRGTRRGGHWYVKVASVAGKRKAGHRPAPRLRTPVDDYLEARGARSEVP